MNYKKLEEEIIALAKSKGELDNLTPRLQGNKTVEEVIKLVEALEHQERGTTNFMDLEGDMKGTNEEIAKRIGNIFTTLIVQMKLQHLDLEDCLQDTDRNYEGPTIL